jgi:hypothetical protein
MRLVTKCVRGEGCHDQRLTLVGRNVTRAQTISIRGGVAGAVLAVLAIDSVTGRTLQGLDVRAPCLS